MEKTDAKHRFAPAALGVGLALFLGACLHTQPAAVSKTAAVDEKGRRVAVYHICEKSINFRDPFGPREISCREERIVHNYCYRSLGNVDCYEKPVPGRSGLMTIQ